MSNLLFSGDALGMEIDTTQGRHLHDHDHVYCISSYMQFVTVFRLCVAISRRDICMLTALLAAITIQLIKMAGILI